MTFYSGYSGETRTNTFSTNMTSYRGYSGKTRTNSNVEWQRKQSATCREEEELITKSAHAAAAATDPLEKLRHMCLSKGAAGIMALGRMLRRMDNDGSKQLNKEEFLCAIKHTGLELHDHDADALFSRFDVDNIGSICVDDFITALQPPMSESRRSIVEKAWRKLDKTGEGIITLEDLRKIYSVNCDPRYMNGEQTAEVTMDMFLVHFEEGNMDGKVILEEFMNYYSGISVSIEHDSYFDLMMRQEYKL